MSINQFKKRIQTEPGWKHLPLDRIEKALQLPKQAELTHAKHWSCGPNSGYRALILNGDKNSDKDDVEYGTISLHYLNLIGYNPHNETVAILDTNNAIEFWSKSDFQNQAKITVPYIRGTWNAVRFY